MCDNVTKSTIAVITKRFDTILVTSKHNRSQQLNKLGIRNELEYRSALSYINLQHLKWMKP